MAALTQFGVAGLVCWMWLSERRSSGERERQISEAHRELMHQKEELGGFVEVIRDNTRVMAAMEAGQRELVNAIDRLGVIARDQHGCDGSGDRRAS